LDQLKNISTKGDIEVNIYDMQKYIGGPAKINTMLFLLKKETKTSSKTVYEDVMEERVCFQPDPITKFGEKIAQYRGLHSYVTEKIKVEVVDLEFPQTQS